MSVQLKNLVQLIKKATEPHENTALRVGSTLELLDSEKRNVSDSYNKSQVLDLVNEAKALIVTGSAFIGSIEPTDTIPAGDLWAFAEEGTYPNAGGVVIPSGSFGIVSRVGATWSATVIATDLNIPDWVASDYSEKTLVIFDNEFYQVREGDTANSGDIPSENSLVWKKIGLSVTETSNSTSQLFDINSMIIPDSYLNASGDKDSATGWQMASVKISDLFEKISVLGNPMTTSSYWRFIDSSGVKLTYGGDGTLNSANPQGLNIPLNAERFQFNIKRASDISPDISNLMVNYGASSLPFEPFRSGNIVMKIDNSDIAASYLLIGDEYVSIDDLFAPKKMQVKKTGNMVLVRTHFNASKDLVFRMTLRGSDNGASNYLGAKLISKSDFIDAAGQVIHDIGDSLPPFQINSRPIPDQYFNVGGNHGMQSVADLTATAHGKTDTDLLSKWKDIYDRTFFLVGILNVNTLRFISDVYVGSDGLDKIYDGIASPLAHISGASNTSNIIFTAGNFTEYKPSINSIQVGLYIDGLEVLEDGTYSGSDIKIIDTHNVADITQPNLVIPYLPQNNGTMVENKLIHNFQYQGVYTVQQPANFQKSHLLTNMGLIQPEGLTKGDYNSHYAFFMNIEDVINLDAFSAKTFMKNDLTDSTKTVMQFSQLLYTEANPIIGAGFGYNPLVGIGKSENLIQNNEQIYLAPTKKTYPRGKTGVSGTEIYQGIGYYAYFDATKNPKLCSDYYIEHGSRKIYFLNIRVGMIKEKIYLEKDLLNKPFEVYQKSQNLTIHTEDISTDEGLIISGNTSDWCVLIF